MKQPAKKYFDQASLISSHLEFMRDEAGSLSILIITLFLLTLIFSLNLINISDAFVAKRELVNIGEMAISDAAHSISLDRYYSGARTSDESAGDGQSLRVPIDCTQASQGFRTIIAASNLRGAAIAITDWQCVNDELTATLTSNISSDVKLPLNLSNPTVAITSTISATSIIGGSR